jgi:putative DNA-invertase from lambdoid prophage Rac
MKAAIYLRVSTDGQDETNQEPDCARLCAARGWEPVFYREHESGAKRRPVWESVKLAAHRGEVGGVVIWALDRAGRDRVRLAHDVAEFARKNVSVISVKESWLDQPVGPLRDLLIQIMGWFAESERARLVERTKAGLARARAQGKKLGRRFLDEAVVKKLRSAWRVQQRAGYAAAVYGLPASTVRTYFARFEKEAATKGAETETGKLAESQGK